MPILIGMSVLITMQACNGEIHKKPLLKQIGEVFLQHVIKKLLGRYNPNVLITFTEY